MLDLTLVIKKTKANTATSLQFFNKFHNFTIISINTQYKIKTLIDKQ